MIGQQRVSGGMGGVFVVYFGRPKGRRAMFSQDGGPIRGKVFVEYYRGGWPGIVRAGEQWSRFTLGNAVGCHE